MRYLRSLGDWSCMLIGEAIAGFVFWVSRLDPCKGCGSTTCGDPECPEEHGDE